MPATIIQTFGFADETTHINPPSMNIIKRAARRYSRFHQSRALFRQLENYNIASRDPINLIHDLASPVVSLTSYPNRIDTCFATLETLARQTAPISALVLTLSVDEFPSRVIPKTLRRLEERGMQILWVEGNIRSYKKLVPVLLQYPKRTIITCDDDVLYERDLVEKLLRASEQLPDCVIGNRCTSITLDNNGYPHPYSSWPHASSNQPPSNRTFPTGAGGVLYPPHSLYREVVNSRLFMKLAPTGDDIWFKAMSILAGVRSYSARDQPNDLLTTPKSQKDALWKINTNRDFPANDLQLQNVFSYFEIYKLLNGR